MLATAGKPVAFTAAAGLFASLGSDRQPRQM